MGRSGQDHKAAQNHRDERDLLARTAMALIDFPPDEDLYAFIGERLRELPGVRYVIVTTFDPANEQATVRAIAGVGPRMEGVLRLLGRHPIGMSLPVDPQTKAAIVDQGLIRLEDGIYEVSFHAIPRPICQALERTFNVDAMYVMPFAEAERIYGAATLLYQDDTEPGDLQTINTLMGLVAVAVKRHQTEEALDASREAYRALFQGVPVGLYQTTPDGRYLNINQACIDLLGCPDRATLLAKDPAEFYADPADRERWMARLEREGEIRNLEGHWRRHDGRSIWVLESTRVVRDAAGNVRYYEGSVQDITARKEMEQQLRRQEQLAALGRLASGIAHDFRNILSTIVLYAQLSQRRAGLPLKVAENLQVIVDETGRAADLVQQILDFTSRAMLDPKPLDLGELLQQSLEILARTLPETIDVTLRTGPASCTVMADPGRIQQVLTNLALNARDAMPRGGALTVTLDRIKIAHNLESGAGTDPATAPGPAGTPSVEAPSVEAPSVEAPPASPVPPGAWARVTVADTGTGMTPEVLDRIFEPYFTTKEVGKGTGLGLPQVYGIVRQHHGHVTVASEPGAGTTFTLYLPLYTAAPEAQAAPPPPPLPAGRGETVLLVEDEVRLREAGEAMLAAHGYRVLAAADGRAALALDAALDAVDLVITDLVMPRMGGKALLHTLRARRPDLPVLAVTGYALAGGDRADLRAAGFDGVLAKPLDIETCARAIREILER
jgi:PAS domain S-box-containing protein